MTKVLCQYPLLIYHRSALQPSCGRSSEEWRVDFREGLPSPALPLASPKRWRGFKELGPPLSPPVGVPAKSGGWISGRAWPSPALPLASANRWRGFKELGPPLRTAWPAPTGGGGSRSLALPFAQPQAVAGGFQGGLGPPWPSPKQIALFSQMSDVVRQLV